MHRLFRNIFAMGHCKEVALYTSKFAEFPFFAMPLFAFRLDCSSQPPTNAEPWNRTVLSKPAKHVRHVAVVSLALTTARS